MCRTPNIHETLMVRRRVSAVSNHEARMPEVGSQNADARHGAGHRSVERDDQ